MCASFPSQNQGLLPLREGVVENSIYKFCAVIGVTCSFWGGDVYAAGAESALDLLDAPVAYSATYRASDGKGVFSGKVWHEPGRERRDFETKSGDQSVLLRRDNDSAYLMKPSGKWYVAVGFHAALSLAGGFDGMSVSRQKVGPDSVEGQNSTRFHITANTKDGRGFVGDLWSLASGIPVKVEGVETEPTGKKTQVSLIQTNIIAGPIEAGRLDVPQGYMGINLKTVSAENLNQAIQSITPLLNGGKK